MKADKGVPNRVSKPELSLTPRNNNPRAQGKPLNRGLVSETNFTTKPAKKG